jgi:hypothetical protein
VRQKKQRSGVEFIRHPASEGQETCPGGSVRIPLMSVPWPTAGPGDHGVRPAGSRTVVRFRPVRLVLHSVRASHPEVSTGLAGARNRQTTAGFWRHNPEARCWFPQPPTKGGGTPGPRSPNSPGRRHFFPGH